MVLFSYTLHQTARLRHSVSYDDSLHRQIFGSFPCMESGVWKILFPAYEYVRSSISRQRGAYRPGNGSVFVLIQEKLPPARSDLLHAIDEVPVKVFLLHPSLWFRSQQSYSAEGIQ